MIPYINDIGLSADEIDRVEELHKRFAFVVYNAGFSCTMEEGRKVEMCYWQNLRGVRQSALFPGHAAAWRDALRVHEEAVDAVKANPGLPEFSADWSIGGEVVKDRDLGRLELETKYTADHGEGWGHHPEHSRQVWQNEVVAGDTIEGYWDWAYNMLQNEDA